MRNKRGAIDNLKGLVISLIAIGVSLTVAFLIFSQVGENVRETQGLDAKGSSTAHPNGTAAYNATEEVINATSDIPGWLPIIIIVAIGGILIALVAMFKRR